MKKRFSTFAILLFSSMVTFGQSDEQTGQIILKLKNESPSHNKSFCTEEITGNSKVDSISQKYNAVKVKKQSTGRKSKQHIYIIKFPAGTNIQQAIEEYYKTGEIEYAEPDHKGSGGGVQGTAPDDQYYSRQWGLKNDGTFGLSPPIAGADIDMENAWSIEQGDSSVIVAIIDSGTKFDHPEFTGRNWINYNEIPNNGMDDDNNGFVDDVQGWDFVNSDNDPTDDHGHGINVAGIIGANGNNSIGYAGVDWNCKLMTLKVLNSNNLGDYSWFADAVYYAVDNGAKVINMSLGGTFLSITFQAAVNYALSNNVVVVVCMMNTNSNTVFYPAGFSGVIAVGSTSPDDFRTSPFSWNPNSGSNYGSHISVVAPGHYIYGLNYQSDTNYDSYWGGTSQATPHVAGLASLLLAQDPTRTPADIKSIIEITAEDGVGRSTEDTPGFDHYHGHGRINAYAALSPLTGISNSKLEDQHVLIFPNPANQVFTVKYPPASRQIQIFNSLGELIQSKDISGQTSEHFEISGQGIYYIQITTNRQTISRKLVVCR